MPEVSTKPYLLRAIHAWCTDNGYTPHIAVAVDVHTRVPMQFVKNGEIVLNISFEAASGLMMDNEVISFSARFGGVSRNISIPVDRVIAIYARENGQGMAFEAPAAAPATGLSSVPIPDKAEPHSEEKPDDEPKPPKKGGNPVLTRIK
ncbi:MAG: ClpXP protease specificity-enhancing factor [Herbaspirillum sp.]